jgi:hypothetical protein
MLETHSKLYGSAVVTYFDGWADALRSAGIDPQSVKRTHYRWPDDRILSSPKPLLVISSETIRGCTKPRDSGSMASTMRVFAQGFLP